ncbi:23S rRNA methyltransferase attenuation leader peptide [Streptococcus plurextorum]|nr:23S rRNA methyltransferase attenuation leader peptide [Streptococcus plurextorum]
MPNALSNALCRKTSTVLKQTKNSDYADK